MEKTPISKKNKKSPAGFVLSALLAGFAITYRTTEAIPFWAYGKVSQDFLIARIYSTLGDYQFDMIVAAILCGCAMKLIGDRFSKNFRGHVLPLVLGFIVILGRSVQTLGDLSGVFGTVPFIIRSFIAAIGFGVIFRYLFALFEGGLEKVSVCTGHPKVFDRLFGEHLVRNVTILLMLLWLPVMIINYPGNHNADFIGQLMQTTGDMPWSGHHPIVLTAFIGIFFGAFKAVTGGYDLALFVWIILQALALAAALSLTLSYLKKKGARIPVLITVLAVYVLSPIYSNIATTAIKDVPFAAACIWYCILTVEYYEDIAAFIKKRESLIKLVIASVLVCICRNNGSIIIFANGLVMCVYGMSKASGEKTDVRLLVKKSLVFLILPLGIYTAMSSGIKAYTRAESDGLKEMLSVPMQQTTLYMIRYEEELTPEEISSINALFGDYHKMIEMYDPFISDPVKQYYDTEAPSEVVSGYLGTWFKMFFKHPGTYFESFFMSTYGWFDPETDTSIRYELDSDYFTRTGLFEGADELLIYFYRYIDRLSVFGCLQSPGLWTWIMIILIRRRKGNLHLYPMQLITLLVCMAGPCFMLHARYSFPIMFTIPFLMGYEGILSAGEYNESDIS